MGFLLLLTMPLLGLSVATEIPGNMKTATLAHSANVMGLNKKTIMFNFNTSSEGIRSPILQHFRTLINVIGLLTDRCSL